jgi:Domain of unknown function (DUF4157)
MANRTQIQKKGSSHFTPPAATGMFKPRPFAETAKPEAATPEVQTKVELGNIEGDRLAGMQVSAPAPIQPKLTIGAPGDKYEQEADTIARKVVKQISAPTPPDANPNGDDGSVQRQFSAPSISRLVVQRQQAIEGGEASASLESTISQAKSSGVPLAAPIRRQMEGAFGADFSGVRIHANNTADTLNRDLSARAFTTGNNIFFKRGEYDPGSSGGKELLAHELTHVVQQGGSQIQAKSTISVQENSLQAMLIQRSPYDVWRYADQPNELETKDPKDILKYDFYSNWFLAKHFLLDPENFIKSDKSKKEVEKKADIFKVLMKKLIALRAKETDNLLKQVRDKLMQKKEFKGLDPDQVLQWSSAGSQSLTSDIDYNLKGAATIEAVGLFNKWFKTKLGWPFDPGTVYDVNVYALDFMTPGETGAPFIKGQQGQEKTITPVQEIPQLNSLAQSQLSQVTGFDAFAINQDVWSLVKMRMYMTDKEWNYYQQAMLNNQPEYGTDADTYAYKDQITAQLQEAQEYYQDYENNLKEKIQVIDQSKSAISKNMHQALIEGKYSLHEIHQVKATKKMMASNLVYEEKLAVVKELRRTLNELSKGQASEAKIKEAGIKLKNALSEAIMYSNEAYFTQGAVHFAVIGQQIGKGESTLIMSEEEYLHSFREQVGDTLKVLNEYSKASIDKAILKAGKYIDRMAKSAIPLLHGNKPNDYEALARVGETAAKLKADKTTLEELKDKDPKDLNKEKGEPEKLAKLMKELPEREKAFPALAKSHFDEVSELRATVVEVAIQVEESFRQYQWQQNAQK